MVAHGANRVFPVPATVVPSGRATMEADLKLGKLGRISPRLHFVDCWPIDGRVCEGYSGRHVRWHRTDPPIARCRARQADVHTVGRLVGLGSSPPADVKRADMTAHGRTMLTKSG
jgi:hypothetical protein